VFDDDDSTTDGDDNDGNNEDNIFGSPESAAKEGRGFFLKPEATLLMPK